MAFNLEHQRSPVWLERARAAALLLGRVPGADTLRIADVGCGDAKLETALGRLPRPWTWTGFDLLPQSERIRPFDVRTDLLPDGAFDVAVLLGVLAYLEDPAAPLERLAGQVPFVLLSYGFPHDPAPVPGWIEPWRTREDLAGIVAGAGLTVVDRTSCADEQVELWLCRRSTTRPNE